MNKKESNILFELKKNIFFEEDFVNFLGEDVLARLIKKFDRYSSQDLVMAIRELCRYLYMVANSPTPIFFPGSKLVDEIWHSLIIETASYRKICNKIRRGSFIDHTGMKFEDYVTERTDEEVNREQLNWLITYYKNFGPVEQQAIKHLPLVKALLDKIEGNIDDLNLLAEALINLTEEEIIRENYSVDNFLNDQVVPLASAIDKDAYVLSKILKKINSLVSNNKKFSEVLPSLELLEKIYGVSTALAFTYAQHLAAVERIKDIKNLSCATADIWSSISSGEKLCGLATTHLARSGKAAIYGRKVSGGFSLNGSAPWVCGFNIFDYLIIGFLTEDSVMFALTDFPKQEDFACKVSSIEMNCLNGTATVRLDFENMFISENSIISSRNRIIQVAPRETIYIIPEIGIGKFALQEIEKIIAQSSDNPKFYSIAIAARELKKYLEQIEEKRNAKEDINQLIVMRDDFNYKAVRLLTICSGSSSMLKNSLVSRLQLEISLFDVILQSPSSLSLKISKLGKFND